MEISKLPISHLSIKIEGLETLKKLKRSKKSLLKYLISCNPNMSLDVNFELIHIEDTSYKPIFKFIGSNRYKMIGIKDITHVHLKPLEEDKFDLFYEFYIF